VYSIPILLRIKRDVERVLLRAFLNDELQTNFHQLKSAFEELLKLFD
jgi:hypothetical protein